MSDNMLPAFMNGTKGKLFTLYFPPQGAECIGAVLHVPAFAEEMNKSRHMVVRQARELAQLGYGVLLFDLYGTGDSEGEFREADWTVWINDVFALIDWLRAQVSLNVTLWGLRLGGLLAANCVSQTDKVKQLFLWQPVLNGEQYIQQFLRLRLAASLMSDGEKETVKSLKVVLGGGESLEVAGYDLSAALFSSIVEANMSTLDVAHMQRIGWLEVHSSVKPLTVVAQKMITAWQDNRSLSVDSQAVQGQQFWSNQEIVWAENLISQTSLLFAGEGE